MYVISVALSRTTMGVLAACCRLSEIIEMNQFLCAVPTPGLDGCFYRFRGRSTAYAESNRQVLLMSTSFRQTV